MTLRRLLHTLLTCCVSLCLVAGPVWAADSTARLSGIENEIDEGSPTPATGADNNYDDGAIKTLGTATEHAPDGLMAASGMASYVDNAFNAATDCAKTIRNSDLFKKGIGGMRIHGGKGGSYMDQAERIFHKLKGTRQTIGKANIAATGASLANTVITSAIQAQVEGDVETAASTYASGILETITCGVGATGAVGLGTLLGITGTGLIAAGAVGVIAGSVAHKLGVAPLVDAGIRKWLKIDENLAQADAMDKISHATDLALKLKKMGISKDAVADALKRYQKGDKSALIGLRNEFLKAQKDLKNKEAVSAVDGQTLDEMMAGLPVNQTYWKDKDKEADDKANLGAELMEIQGTAEQAAEIAAQADLDAGAIRNDAGNNAQQIGKAAASAAADGQSKDSTGNILTEKVGDAITSGATVGAEIAGKAAAHTASDEIFGDEKKKPACDEPPPPKPPPPKPTSSGSTTPPKCTITIPNS